PPGGVLNPPGNTNFNHGGWTVRILPYMEQVRQIPNLDVPFRNALPDAIADGLLPATLPYLRCPSDPDFLDKPLTNYAGSQGPQCWHGSKCGVTYDINQKYCNGTSDEPPRPKPYIVGYSASPNLGRFLVGQPVAESQVRGMFGTYGPAIRMESVTDGTCNTLLVGEYLPAETRSRDAGSHWALAGPGRALTTIIPINHHTNYLGDDGCTIAPDRYYKNANVADGFRSWHSGGVNFAFADASIRFLSQTIDRKIYQYLGCRNDGQVA